MRFFKIDGISGFEGLEMAQGRALKGPRVRVQECSGRPIGGLERAKKG